MTVKRTKSSKTVEEETQPDWEKSPGRVSPRERQPFITGVDSFAFEAPVQRAGGSTKTMGRKTQPAGRIGGSENMRIADGRRAVDNRAVKRHSERTDSWRASINRLKSEAGLPDQAACRASNELKSRSSGRISALWLLLLIAIVGIGPWQSGICDSLSEPGQSVKQAQWLLKELGYDVVPDGILGPRTKAVIRNYERENNMVETGQVTVELIASLQAKPKQKGKVFRDCAECPEMIVIPAGSYRMGSPAHEVGRYSDEGPVHRVTIAKPFAVGRYEVMRAEFAHFADEVGFLQEDENCDWLNPLEPEFRQGERDPVVCVMGFWPEDENCDWLNPLEPEFRQGERDPVVCVDWNDAQAYAEWLSRKTGKAYRLLSESEWEYAARGGTSTARYWGEHEDEQCRYANGIDAAYKKHNPSLKYPVAPCNDGHVYTSPAGSFLPNEYGLYDMLGNVNEWVEDCWNDDYAAAPSDGSAWLQGDCSARMFRGGSWGDIPRYLRSAIRYAYTTGDRDDYIGFRVARTLD